MGEEGERTCYVSNFADDVTSDLLEELFTQVGPLQKVHLIEKPGASFRYALVVFQDEESVPFAIETLDGVELYKRGITVKPRSGTKQEDVYKSKRGSGRIARNLPQPYMPVHLSGSEDRRERESLGMKPVRAEGWRQSRNPNAAHSNGGSYDMPPQQSGYYTPQGQSSRPQASYKINAYSARGNYSGGGNQRNYDMPSTPQSSYQQHHGHRSHDRSGGYDQQRSHDRSRSANDRRYESSDRRGNGNNSNYNRNSSYQRR